MVRINILYHLAEGVVSDNLILYKMLVNNYTDIVTKQSHIYYDKGILNMTLSRKQCIKFIYFHSLLLDSFLLQLKNALLHKFKAGSSNHFKTDD